MSPRASCPSPKLLLLAAIIVMFLAATHAQTPSQHCSKSCGSVNIPYPFGVEPGCYLPGFGVICNKTFNPPRAFLNETTVWTISGFYSKLTTGQPVDGTVRSTPSRMELMEVSVNDGEARMFGGLSINCPVNQTTNSFRRNIYSASSNFVFSSHNVLTGIGLNADARLTTSTSGSDGAGIISCVSRPNVNSVARDGSTCTGQGCCQAASSQGLSSQVVVIIDRVSYVNLAEVSNCSFGMFAQKGWYNYTAADVYGNEAYMANKFPQGAPLVLGFAIRNGACPVQGQPQPGDYACISGNSSCVTPDAGPGYRCQCSDGYQGNSYVVNGCQDIDECMDTSKCNGDHQTCVNTEGSYHCGCKGGWKNKGGTCTEPFPLPAKVVVGAIGGLLLIAVLIFIALIQKEKKKMREFFERNGGPTLEKAKTIKIFKKEELKPFITSDNFLGKGSFGEVYKGILDENMLVAVKKPINISVSQNEQFANEVIIQSQVIHKNIVKLIGCCLEVDIPMLVYEFVSKGSLDDILHGSTKVPLDLGMRLNIAAESAEGLAYMHSGTTTTVLHGDVKPANILLNDNYVPKISDFGISKLINKNVTQHTNSVIGDMTYMDPVYMQTGLLTDKSDVYSFGVVLLELISRKRATYSDNNSLVRSFVDGFRNQKKVTELFDVEIGETTDMELLDCLAGIAVECLNMDVHERPEMTDVAERLVVLKRSLNK